ncbi:hypothetical protein KM043_016391 [Ampulex compressa]|nr:hypothetical protein KM043_016391 [Ampulex compressa]
MSWAREFFSEDKNTKEDISGQDANASIAVWSGASKDRKLSLTSVKGFQHPQRRTWCASRPPVDSHIAGVEVQKKNAPAGIKLLATKGND